MASPERILPCSFAELRRRALALAGSGKFDSWEAVAGALERDNCAGAVARVKASKPLQRELTELCEESDAEGDES
jgi:hypothetical protein